MTLVRPPSLEELIKTYGSPKAAIQHLIESGFTPEEIEWKLGIPYYLVRLYIEGKKLTDTTLFSSVVKAYERIAVLRSKKGKETELANFFKRDDLSLEMKTRFALGVMAEESLKIGSGTVETAISLATGEPSHRVRRLLIDYGEHGEVAFLLTRSKEAKLTVEEVYEAIRLLPKMAKIMERHRHIASLLKVSTPEEAKYIVRLLLGDLELGYYQRTVVEAAAKAYGVPAELIASASAIIGITEGMMLARAGELALSSLKLRSGQFLKPQLAHLYEPDKVEYPARAEFKFDGSRLQIHKWGTQVWLYSRRAIEKSQIMPEVVEIAEAFKAQSCIVDSEVVAIDEKGGFLPFQHLLERTVPRELTEGELKERRRRVNITIKVFDILFLNGRELTDLSLSERRKYLLEVVPAEYLAEGKDCSSEIELMKFYEEALRQGFEGVVVKNLNSKYEAGERTYTWLKLKPERDTIDCTIVKALFGKGKRTGFYSSFLMAVRDPEKKQLYTIGKVSNLSEEAMMSIRDIVEQTRISEDDEGVFIKPSIVIEATYQEIQETDEYTSGYALRVPKIVRFRHDKKVEEIDDIEKVRKLYEMQYERYVQQTV